MINPDAKSGCFGLLAIVGLTGLSVAVIGLWHELFGDKRPYNPNVFPAIKAIEQRCISQDFMVLTVRCDEVRKIFEECNRNQCLVDDVYKKYTKLMFDLPPLRIDPSK